MSVLPPEKIEDLHALIAATSGELAKIEAELAEVNRARDALMARRRHAISLLDHLRASVESNEGLSVATDSATFGGVTEGQSRYAARLAESGGPHAVKAWLYKRPPHIPGPRSSDELATALRKRGHRCSGPTVRAWWATEHDRRRRTPEALAREIEAMGGPAATDANYPNGIRRAKSA